MYMKSITRGSPEVVISSVRNAMTTPMLPGDAVFWNGLIGGTGTTLIDGWSVTVGSATTTLQQNLGMFAGLVVNNDIPGGSYGEVQHYGVHAGGFVTGSTAAAPFTSQYWMTNITQAWASLQSVILRPVNGAGVVGGSATRGYLAPIQLVTTLGVTTGDAIQYWPGGYVIPLANPAATLTYTSSGSVKCFIKALG